MSANKLFERIPFTKDIKNRFTAVRALTTFQNLEAALSGTDFPKEDLAFVMTRTNTMSLSNNIDSFVIYTSAHPNEMMTYTATDDMVVMNDTIDGGVF